MANDNAPERDRAAGERLRDPVRPSRRRHMLLQVQRETAHAALHASEAVFERETVANLHACEARLHTALTMCRILLGEQP